MFINSGQYQLIIMQRLHNELPVVDICNLPNIIAKTIREDKVTRKRFKRSSLLVYQTGSMQLNMINIMAV